MRQVLAYTAIAVAAVIASLAINIWIVGDYVELRSRIDALEKEVRFQHAILNIALDSINELANPGSSITIENTVPEVRK